MKKIIKYFPLNKGIVEEEIKTLIKPIAIYLGTAIVVLTIANVTDWIPVVKNLTFNISNIYGYYILAGMGLACYQYFGGKDYSEEEFITLNDVKALWNSSKGKIILGAALVVLCLIPHKDKVKTASVQEQVAQEVEVQENEIEIAEEEITESGSVDENIASDEEMVSVEEEMVSAEDIDVEQKKTYEVVLSEEMNYGEAEWVDAPHGKSRDDVAYEYNKAMLSMTNSDKKYGNVIYINDKAIALPIKISEFFEVIGEDESTFDKYTSETKLKSMPIIKYKSVCLSDNMESIDDWYVYGIDINVREGFLEADSAQSDSKACKVVLPGGLVVNKNIDLTLSFGLEEEGEKTTAPYSVTYEYKKEGYGTYVMIADKYYIPGSVSYEIDFVKETPLLEEGM